jgi:hypothetical protein
MLRMSDTTVRGVDRDTFETFLRAALHLPSAISNL